jgi:O-antigen/teichoic acid export membrane protein
MCGLGLIAALSVVAITPWLTADVLTIPFDLRTEAEWSFRILAATLPFVVSTSGLIGILEAHQRFQAISLVRIPLGVMTFLGPVVVVTLTPSLVAITAVLGGSRVLAWTAYVWLRRACTETRTTHRFFDWTAARELLSFGGWVTVSNVVSPVMVYFDRFLIGALISMTAVTYYTTPYEVVTRFWTFPAALMGVLFPALTTALVANRARARKLYSVGAQVLLIAMSTPVALVVLFAPEALTVWLGPDFARESTSVLRWLAVGVFINSLSRVPFATLQGQGRPDLSAKLHLAELPFYVAILSILATKFGIVGVAIAWTFRIILDTAALFALAIRQSPELRPVQLRALFLTALTAGIIALLAIPGQLWLKALLATAIIGIAVGLGLRLLSQMRVARRASAPAQWRGTEPTT